MKEILKRIAIVGSGIALLSGTAFASVGNNGTGENSENEVNWRSENQVTVTTDNEADINNDVDVSASTGWNCIFDMIMNQDNHDDHNDRHDDRDDEHDQEDQNNANGDAAIDTGNASATANITNRANVSNISVTAPSMVSGNIGNMDTGRNSENEVDARLESRVNVETNNDADVHNDVDVTANTGHNMISGGGAGDKTITTGNATASVNLTNTVNSTTVTVK